MTEAVISLFVEMKRLNHSWSIFAGVETKITNVRVVTKSKGFVSDGTFVHYLFF